MRIIPAIDIINGHCVRLEEGDFSTKKVYDTNPVDVAKRFQDAGIEYLHVVDLDGARLKKITNYKVLEAIANQTDLKIDFGGGLASNDDLRIAFECGSNQVTAGSVAVKNPLIFLNWLKTYGAEKIILGADCRDEKIAVSGWTEISDLDLMTFLDNRIAEGIEYTICTDISRDGLLQGPAVELYEKILYAFPGLKLIASGGVSSIEDLEALKQISCDGAIVGKAIYEKRIKLKELERFIISR